MSSGGKREGAGRPRKDNQVSLHVRVPVEVEQEVRDRAKAQGKSKSDVVAEAIMNTRNQRGN